MSIRWKTAIKFGLTWGLLMAVFSLLFDLQEKMFSDIVTSGNYWLRSAGYIILGIFPVGYFSAQEKQD